MKVKPLKIKIKQQPPTAAERLYQRHQAIRKEKGLPDPSEYKKKLDNMKENKTTEVPTSLKPGHDEKKAKEVASKAKGNLVKGRQQSAGKDKAGKKLWWEEVEQLDELSPETKQSYKSKALLQIKELKPWTKKGEYKDLAKNMITKREKGVAKVDEQHVSGRFRPVKPHNVKSTATASPRPTSDSANVRLREADEVKPDQITTDSQKFPKKMSRKAQIVRNAAKKVPVDQFQANPILDSDVNPQTNKQ